MSKVKGFVGIVGLAAVIVFAVACGNGEAAATEQPAPPAQVAPSTGAPAQSAQPAVPPVAAPAPAPVSAPAQPSRAVDPPSGVSSGARAPSVAPQVAGSSQAGIVVTGQGKMSLEPDLALVNIGVETQARTVAEARDLASRAMDAIVAAVTAHGLTNREIQTRSFNIWPNYDFQEEFGESGRRTSQRILVGYTVNNTASIKIKDLDKVGEIIDDVTNAGGDSTRIDGVRFTVEDTEPFMADLREAAVNDALAKAEHYATLAGVTLGNLVFLSEGGAGVPRVQDFGTERGFAMAAAAPAPQTSISGGELELTLTVQTAFAIE